MASSAKVRFELDGLQAAASDAAGLDCSRDVPLTKQEFREECDLNTIMRQYTQTGILPEARVASYGDFSDALDFREAQEILVRSREQFEALPAEVRYRFRNDPAEFLEFVQDRNNFSEARKLGLLSAEAEAAADARAAAEAAKNAPAGAPAPASP